MKAILYSHVPFEQVGDLGVLLPLVAGDDEADPVEEGGADGVGLRLGHGLGRGHGAQLAGRAVSRRAALGVLAVSQAVLQGRSLVKYSVNG